MNVYALRSRTVQSVGDVVVVGLARSSQPGQAYHCSGRSQTVRHRAVAPVLKGSTPFGQPNWKEGDSGLLV